MQIAIPLVCESATKSSNQRGFCYGTLCDQFHPAVDSDLHQPPATQVGNTYVFASDYRLPGVHQGLLACMTEDLPRQVHPYLVYISLTSGICHVVQLYIQSINKQMSCIDTLINKRYVSTHCCSCLILLFNFKRTIAHTSHLFHMPPLIANRSIPIISRLVMNQQAAFKLLRQKCSGSHFFSDFFCQI